MIHPVTKVTVTSGLFKDANRNPGAPDELRCLPSSERWVVGRSLDWTAVTGCNCLCGNIASFCYRRKRLEIGSVIKRTQTPKCQNDSSLNQVFTFRVTTGRMGCRGWHGIVNLQSDGYPVETTLNFVLVRSLHEPEIVLHHM